MAERTDDKSGSRQGSESGKVKNSDARDMNTRSGRTAGTNRDFDEAGESRNQGHGHPREERGGSDSGSD